MFSTPIQDFERMTELQFLLIINPANCNAEENYPDYSMAVYTLDRRFEMEEFLDMIEMYSDLILLFRHTATKDNDSWADYLPLYHPARSASAAPSISSSGLAHPT